MTREFSKENHQQGGVVPACKVSSPERQEAYRWNLPGQRQKHNRNHRAFAKRSGMNSLRAEGEPVLPVPHFINGAAEPRAFFGFGN